jgi:hypothetical protein
MVVRDAVWHHHHVLCAVHEGLLLVGLSWGYEMRTAERGRICVEVNLCAM